MNENSVLLEMNQLKQPELIHILPIGIGKGIMSLEEKICRGKILTYAVVKGNMREVYSNDSHNIKNKI